MARCVHTLILLCYIIPSIINNSTNYANTPNNSTQYAAVFLNFHFRFLPKLGCLPFAVGSKHISKSLSLLLLLAGDIAVNPGPVLNSIEDLSLAFTNIRSIKNRHTSISNFVLGHNIHALGLSETWLTNDTTDSFLSEITPSGYQFFHKPSSCRTINHD